MSYQTRIENGVIFYEFPNGDSYESLADAFSIPYKTIEKWGITIELYHANGNYGSVCVAKASGKLANGLSENHAINRLGRSIIESKF